MSREALPTSGHGQIPLAGGEGQSACFNPEVQASQRADFFNEVPNIFARSCAVRISYLQSDRNHFASSNAGGANIISPRRCAVDARKQRFGGWVLRVSSQTADLIWRGRDPR